MIEVKDLYKKGKLLNRAMKCDSCGEYRLKPMSQDYHSTRSGFKDNVLNFFQCQSCFAEFEAVKVEVEKRV